jgi:hypothetical protein
MKIFRSLLFLIITILTLLACSTLYLGYYLNINTLRATLESRELEKLNGTYATVNSLIKEEAEELLSLADLLKTSDGLPSSIKNTPSSG